MKVLILGGTGMLGHKLVQRLGPRFETAAAFRTLRDDAPYLELFAGIRCYTGIEAEDMASIQGVLEDFRPDVVVNAIGVIKQLAEAKDVITSLTINAIFPQRLAELSRSMGFRFVHVSTDCVFDGRDGGYTEDDTPNALDLYGQSKHWGEVDAANCLTLRTSIIGRELESSHSLVDWFLTNRGGTVRGFRRAIYSGFPTLVFADIIGDLIANRPDISGLYQVSSDAINKFDLLELVNTEFNAGVSIEPFDDFVIDRSLDSTRFRQLTGFEPMPWPEMIRAMAEDDTPYDLWRSQSR